MIPDPTKWRTKTKHHRPHLLCRQAEHNFKNKKRFIIQAGSLLNPHYRVHFHSDWKSKVKVKTFLQALKNICMGLGCLVGDGLSLSAPCTTHRFGVVAFWAWVKEGEVGTCRRGAMGREGRRESIPYQWNSWRLMKSPLGVKGISIKGAQSLHSETS